MADPFQLLSPTKPDFVHRNSVGTPRQTPSAIPGISLFTSGPTGIQAHIYESFLHGICADVKVVVERWGKEYYLHKMVLAQAGFFHSLFLGGFSEESSPSTKRPWHGSSFHIQTIDLQFDDHNITRPAFEFILSRLYAGGSDLYINPTNHPTPTHPLTPSFPPLPTTHPLNFTQPPQHQQPATARFLLSLLATSIYLGLPSLTQSVLTTIIGTVSPFNVTTYLRFSIGEGIGPDLYGEDNRGAVGLESIARDIEVRLDEIKDKSMDSNISAHNSATTPVKEGVKRERMEDELTVKADSESVDFLSTESLKTPNSPAFSTASESPSPSLSNFTVPLDEDSPPFYFYGIPSGKIGEACACWLARWGWDVMEAEERAEMIGPAMLESSFGQLSVLQPPKKTVPKHVRSLTLPSSPPKNNDYSSFNFNRKQQQPITAIPGLSFLLTSQPPTPPRPSVSSDTPKTASNSSALSPVWGVGGLPAAWCRAVISSDAFFVKNEWERYVFAKRVVELRRVQREKLLLEHDGMSDIFEDGELDEEVLADEDAEMEELFGRGIYYAHMTFDELSFISRDISPTTGIPYAPLPILQASLWRHQELRSRIQSSAPVGTVPSSPIATSPSTPSTPKPEAELKITCSTAEIAEELRRFTTSHHAPPTSHRKGKRNVSGSSSASFGSNTSSPSIFGGFGLLGGNGLPEQKTFWPVPSDDTHRFGESGGFIPLSGPISQVTLTDGPPNMSISGTRTKATLPALEEDFFGIGIRAKRGSEILEGSSFDTGSSIPKELCWTTYEPYRFSVEFWGIADLKEKQREYSSTVFYAGSFFNVYVQTIRKKDKQVQLGVYLHRQSMLEPLPPASVPPKTSTINTPGSNLSDSRRPSTPDNISPSSPVLSTSAPNSSGFLNSSQPPLTRTMSSSPTAGFYMPPLHEGQASSSRPHMSTSSTSVTLSSTLTSGSSSSSSSPQPLQSPYRDPRKTIKCFFSISCPSALGTALTRFSSAPDQFSVSQSWGWKSSSLRSEEYLSVNPPAGTENLEDGVLGMIYDLPKDGRLQSLRATVVVGLV